MSKNYEKLDELTPKTIELHRAIFDEGYYQGYENGCKDGMKSWIPVNERKPIDNGWYQCTTKTPENYRMVIDLYFKNGKWLDNRRIDMFEVYRIYGYGHSDQEHLLKYDEFDNFNWTDYVIAWMPLPEPYKGDKDV